LNGLVVEADSIRCEEDVDVPQQMNGSDCGICALTYSLLTALNIPIAFLASHIPFLRRKFLADILHANIALPLTEQDPSVDIDVVSNIFEFLKVTGPDETTSQMEEGIKEDLGLEEYTILDPDPEQRKFLESGASLVTLGALAI
jgi:hypothetical protein